MNGGLFRGWGPWIRRGRCMEETDVVINSGDAAQVGLQSRGVTRVLMPGSNSHVTPPPEQKIGRHV